MPVQHSSRVPVSNSTPSGLDPRRWFNHVELIAAKRIGRETVQYVANIYKYYLAYQMVMWLDEQREKAKAASES